MNNVFVTGTGRCGTVSFKRACEHIINYDCGHETNNGLLLYPDNFIEVNPMIRAAIVTLVKKYPNSKWVHLIRSSETCIPSLAELNDGSVVKAFRSLHNSIVKTGDLTTAAEFYYQHENDRIHTLLEHFGELQSIEFLTIQLETIKEQWGQFWRWIEAEGDFQASLNTWNVPHNTSEERRRKVP